MGSGLGPSPQTEGQPLSSFDFPTTAINENCKVKANVRFAVYKCKANVRNARLNQMCDARGPELAVKFISITNVHSFIIH